MHKSSPNHTAPPRSGYATCADFCGILVKNLRPLYLLAFVLTGNHTEAEQCFVATIDDCIGAKSVFKGWENSWSKRCLIINAIRRVFSTPGESRPAKRREAKAGSPERLAILGLIRMPPLHRFVFVMSVLERYTVHECALLLHCPVRNVLEARINALSQLSSFGPQFIKAEERRTQITIGA
jgi:hypothetical protein